MLRAQATAATCVCLVYYAPHTSASPRTIDKIEVSISLKRDATSRSSACRLSGSFRVPRAVSRSAESGPLSQAGSRGHRGLPGMSERAPYTHTTHSTTLTLCRHVSHTQNTKHTTHPSFVPTPFSPRSQPLYSEPTAARTGSSRYSNVQPPFSSPSSPRHWHSPLLRPHPLQAP